MGSLQSGREVAHYRIVERLGAGGMGEVYHAWDGKLERAVALKILPPELVANPDRVRRFVQEARSASSLSHPHIIAIHDIGEARVPVAADPLTSSAHGETQAIHYIAMELVEGATLREKIHEQKSDLKDLVTWLAQAAEGLAKAHAAGIVHRDLKPENIMVTRDGYAKVLDFGLAKLVEIRGSDTNAATAVRDETGVGAVLGTVGYMSPEQVEGKKVDHRSDVFSFGCILYEAATRQKPFSGESNVDVMHQILHAKPPAIHEINPKVPSELRRMIRRCLAKDPERRFQSMKDVSLELADIVDEWDDLVEENGARSTSSTGSIPPVVRGRRLPLLVALAAFVAIIGVAAVMLLESSGDASEEVAAPNVRFSRVTTEGGAEALPMVSPDGNFIVYVRTIRGPRASSSSPGSSGGEGDIMLLRVGGRNAINLTNSPGIDDTMPAFSPDGQTIAFRSERDGGGIFVMGATGESVRRLTEKGFYPAWSPDGSMIVYSTEGPENPFARSTVSALWVVEVASGEKKKIYEGDAVQARWSPGGERIAFWGLPHDGKSQRDLGSIPAGGGEAVWITNDAAIDWNPVWAPDGRAIYFSSDRGGSLNVWRIAVDEKSGKPEGSPQPMTAPVANAGFLSVAKDGKKLVFQSLEPKTSIEIAAVDATGKVSGSRPITSTNEVMVEPDVSPDGAWVVYRTAAPEDLFLARTDGSEVIRLTNDPENDRAPRWTRDGKQIVFYSARGGRYEIWRIRPDASGLEKLSETTGPAFWYPAPSPDGRTIVAGNEWRSGLFDLSEAIPARTLRPIEWPSPNEAFFGSDWSADGKEIAGAVVALPSIVMKSVTLYSLEKKTYEHIADVAGDGRVRWAPDGKTLLLASGSRIVSIDRASRGQRTLLEVEGAELANASMTADGSAVVYGKQVMEGDVWMATME